MPDTYFSSDHHFDHRKIIEYSDRPFADVDEMNEQMITRWNDTVGVDDDVWLLGDLSLGSIRRMVDFVSRLNGRKRLIPGNHDPAWKGHRKQRTAPYYEAGIVEIVDSAEFTIAGELVVASHFPYYPDTHDWPGYDPYRPTDTGGWLLHGHIHEKWRQNGKQINVGVDAWDYRPVHIDQIAELIEAGSTWLDRLEPTFATAA